MHWVEGAFMAAVGFIPWLIAAEKFPGDPQQRAVMLERMPLLKNKALLRGAAIFLWALGGAAVLGLTSDLT
jgi:hypothetical protein